MRNGNVSDLDLRKYKKICIGTFTWGYGKIPRDVKEWIVENKDLLSNKFFYLFGSGNSIYPKFCGALDNIEIILQSLDSEVYNKVKIDQRFNEGDYTESQLLNIKKSIKNFSEVDL